MITIVIVSYNDNLNRELLYNCLKGVTENTRYNKTPFNLVVISDRDGHVQAWNKALRISAPNDVIMLSDDVVIKDENWVEKLQRTAKEQGVGFSTPIADEKSRGMFKYPWGLMGFCYLNRDAIEKVGYFDERFFCGYEEDDYCIRMMKAGLRPEKVKEEIYHTHVYNSTLGRIHGTKLEMHFGDGLRKLKEKWGF